MVDQAFVWGGWRCCVTCLVRLIHFAFTLVWPLIAKWNRSNCLGIHHNWASFSNWQRDHVFFKDGPLRKVLLNRKVTDGFHHTPSKHFWLLFCPNGVKPHKTSSGLCATSANVLWIGWIEKKNVKKNHKKSRNRRPWYPRTTSKVNIQTFGWTKCTMCAMYCKKFQCFCSCFSLFCYYAHFSN